MKMFKFLIAMACFLTLNYCVTFSSRARSMKMQKAEEVLDSLKRFNDKYSSLKGNQIIYLIKFFFQITILVFPMINLIKNQNHWTQNLKI